MFISESWEHCEDPRGEPVRESLNPNSATSPMKHVSVPTQDNHDYKGFSLGRELVTAEDCHSFGIGGGAQRHHHTL